MPARRHIARAALQHKPIDHVEANLRRRHCALNVKQVESAHVDEFSRMTNEELEAFIREGIAELDASQRRSNVRGA